MALLRKAKNLSQRKFHYILLLFFIIICIFNQAKTQSSSLKKISHVNLLLPICIKTNCNPVYAKLQAFNGCYEWTSDNSRLIDLLPIQKPEDNSGCYSEVIISSNSKSTKDIIYVTARDKKSNVSFRCKVGFAEVSKISIEKNFDRLYVNEIFELHVLAHDERGNIFSSLEGWKFNWKIIEGHSSAQLMKLTDHGKIELSKQREIIEKDSQSDIVLIKGIETGKIIITVDILEDYLKDTIFSEKRELYIIEPFKIIPERELYILPNTKFDFNLMYTNSKTMIMPSHHRYFVWTVEDTSCGIIKGFGHFTSNSHGCTVNIKVRDTRLEKYNTDEKLVHVEYPNNINLGYLEVDENDKKIFEKVKLENELQQFNLSPTFKLIENKNYIFKNFLMYDNEPIYYDTSGVYFTFELSNLYPYINKNKITYKYNQELAYLTTTKITSGENIQSSVEIQKGNLLTVHKTIIIYEKVKIKKFNMPYFTLPYLGYSSNGALLGQELHLIVTGGTGNYEYTTSNNDIVEIIQNKYLMSRKKGIANIIVSDKEASTNQDNIDIHVDDIKSFTYIEERQEIPVDNKFMVTSVALNNIDKELENKYHQNNIFTNCTNIKLTYEKNIDGLIKKVENYNYYRVTQYYQVREFIENNVQSINEKMNFLNVKNNSENYEYYNYSNFGICNSDSFLALEEGLLKLVYKSMLSNKESFNNMNYISSFKPARVYIYRDMEIENILEDNFTKFMIDEIKITNPDKNKEYVMAEGNSITLKLRGGIIPWTDYFNDYVEEKLVVEKEKNVYDASKISRQIKISNIKEKQILFYCNKKGYEYDFMISIHNKKDKSLLRPGNSKVNFKIKCQNPNHLSIYLLSQTYNFVKLNDFSLNEIFNTPQKPGIEYFIKKNSADILRVYGFDENKRIFVNISSLKGKWEKTSKISDYFDLINKKELIKNPSDYIKDKEIIQYSYSNDFEFLQDFILFKSYVQTFDLKYILKSNINNHHVTIHMIDLPELYPNNLTIYVREDNIFTLDIIKGSGDFDIKLSDDSLALFRYDRNIRKIYFTPLRQGVLIVTVRDNQLGSNFNYECKSKIYLSDVKSILLYGGGLLMVNKSIELGIEIFDNFDNKFGEDQLSKIPLIINESFPGIDVTFSKNNTFINVTGYIPGLYPIIIKENSREILSNIAKVEVFEKLQIFPPYLLLVPGSSYTLSITGGPQNRENVIINYEVENKDIANVTKNYPLVYGKIYGDTVLKISLLYKYDYNKFYNINDDKHIINKTDLLCMENVPIRVDFPDRVEIIGGGNDRKIYTKSTIRLLAALKKGNEVFTYGIGPFKFDWSVDNNIVAHIRYFIKKSLFQNDGNNNLCNGDSCNINKEEFINSNSDFDQNCDECKTTLISTKKDFNPSNSIGVFLYSFEEGVVTVSLTVTVTYPKPYTMHKPYAFSTTEKININDEIYVDLPAFYGNSQKKTGLYMIPYNVDHELHTNKETEQLYSIVKQYDNNDSNNQNAQIVSLTSSGRITSYFRKGIAYISVSQLNGKDMRNNNVPVILPIYVSDFHSIFIEKTHTIIDMEVSQELILKVIIQHEHGLLFAEKFDRMNLRAVVSHPNIANVDLIEVNSKLKIKAQNIGETNVILFHPESRKIYDVFKLNVVQQVTLLNKIVLSVGGSINFFGKDANKKKELTKNSEWVSDNPNVMKVDSRTGVGVALNEGQATIALKMKDSQKIHTSTQVYVRKINKVSFDKSILPKTFTDIRKNGINFINEYRIPIILYSIDDEIFTDNKNDALSIINQNIKIKCESDEPNYVKADEINKDNINECVFTIRENRFSETKRSRRAWSKQMEDKPKNINIQLTVEDYNRRKNTVQEIIPFASAFKIKNDLRIINLTYKIREYIIYVDNLNDLDIKLSNEHLVKIEEVNREKRYIKIKIPYSVEEDFRGVVLYLVNVLSGQKEEIIINFNNNITSSPGNNSLTDYILFIILTGVLILIGYCLFFTKRRLPNQFNNQRNVPFYGSGPGFQSNGMDYDQGVNNRGGMNDFTNRGFGMGNSNNGYGYNLERNFNNMMNNNVLLNSQPRGSAFNIQGNRGFGGPYERFNNQ